MEQQSVPPVMGQSAPQSSPVTLWYIVLAVVVLGFGALYFLMQSPAASEPQALEEGQAAEPTEGNTTSDISADLSQIPDSSASLDSDAEGVAADVQGL